MIFLKDAGLDKLDNLKSRSDGCGTCGSGIVNNRPWRSSSTIKLPYNLSIQHLSKLFVQVFDNNDCILQLGCIFLFRQNFS